MWSFCTFEGDGSQSGVNSWGGIYSLFLRRLSPACICWFLVISWKHWKNCRHSILSEFSSLTTRPHYKTLFFRVITTYTTMCWWFPVFLLIAWTHWLSLCGSLCGNKKKDMPRTFLGSILTTHSYTIVYHYANCKKYKHIEVVNWHQNQWSFVFWIPCGKVKNKILFSRMFSFLSRLQIWNQIECTNNTFPKNDPLNMVRVLLYPS